MHEPEKLREAEFFHTQMLAHRRDADVIPFKYYVSAFLSAARSVLQYALDEAQGKPAGQKWYDTEVPKSVVPFFKERRDVNVHKVPIIPGVGYRVEVGDSLNSSVPVSSTISSTFIFQEWTGTGDAVELCAQYLQRLKDIVADGQAKGFLTP